MLWPTSFIQSRKDIREYTTRRILNVSALHFQRCECVSYTNMYREFGATFGIHTGSAINLDEIDGIMLAFWVIIHSKEVKCV